MERIGRGGSASTARLRNLADEELMQLVYESNADAFEVIYDRHANVAFSLAYRMCGRRSTAEDIVQESFMSLWRTRASYDCERASVRTWLLGIVHNRAVDVLRRGAVRDRGMVYDEDAAESVPAQERTDVQATRGIEARQVRNALEHLPGEQSKVIELAYFGGLTHVQIASMVGAPVGTVKGRMRLGLAKMKVLLGDSVEVPS